MTNTTHRLREDFVVKLLALWEKGMTGSEIAKELGTTRNAVMGKLHRLKAEGRVVARPKDMKKVAVADEEKPRQPKEPKPKREKPTLITLPSTTVQRGLTSKPVVPVVERVKRGPVRFADLTRRACRYVINNGRPETYLFCGEVSAPGLPYCEDHAKLCYRVPITAVRTTQ